MTETPENLRDAVHGLLAGLPRVRITPDTITQRTIDRWYEREAQYRQQLALAHEYRIPCPGHPYGPDAFIVVRRGRHDRGDHDRWVITDGNETAKAWTGERWAYFADLHRDEIFRWPTLTEALAEAGRVAAGEGDRVRAAIAETVRKHEEQQP